MKTSEGMDLLASALTPEERKQIPSEISKKISEFASAKLDELITARALSETGRFTAEEALKNLQEKFETVNTIYEETKAKFEVSSKSVSELESQLSTAVQDVARLQASCSKLEQENAEMRRQRNLAVDEKEDLLKMVERRTGEVERMQADMNALTKQLESAIVAKCEAIAAADDVESKRLSMECREKWIEQEKQLINSQMETLTRDLKERTEELLNLRRDNSLRCIQLESKLTEKEQELSSALENIKTLTEVNANLTQRAEELVQKLQSEKETMIKTQESFEHELNAQVKLADLYKRMSDDKIEYAQELANGFQEVKEKLDDAIERYGDLETKFKEAELTHEDILMKKNECIDVLKKELESANEVLSSSRFEFTDKKLEELCPTSTAIPKSSRPGTMTMTQMMTEINRLTDLLADRDEEIAKLKAYLNQIEQQIQEKAPLLIRQREEYESALENIEDLTRANDMLTNEIQQLREDMAECKRSEATVVRENDRLNKDVLDLSRQVCHLLKEVEASRVGVSSSTSTDMSDSQSSADIISKNLVTFSDIPSLQATNQKLRAVVRELSAKQEEAEAFDPAAIAELQTKLESLRTAHCDLLAQQESSAKMMKILVDQRDLYKTMYLQVKKGEDVTLPPEMRENQESQSSKDDDSIKEDKIQELETKLDKAKKDLSLLKEETENYKKEKAAHERILVEQMDKMRGELQALSSANAKLLAKCESNDELFKTLKSNTEIYKKQVETLQDRNKMYNEIIIKHETTFSMLSEQTRESQTKLSTVEAAVHNLEKENSLLKDANTRLERECEQLRSERHSTSVLHSNIELIKATLERKDAESRIRLEEQLKDAHRELAAMRRRMQEEQERYMNLSSHLEKQTQNAQSRMEEEKQQADKFRNDLAELREEYAAKMQQVEDLSKKLKTSMLAGVDHTPDSKKFKELQKMYEDTQAEVTSLQQKLKISKETVLQHCNIAEAAEKQLQEVLSAQNDYKKKTEEMLQQREKQISELTEKCSELQAELSVQTDGQEEVSIGMRSKIRHLEDTHKSSESELNEIKKELENARAEIRQLNENLEAAEAKYTREMMLHSSDLTALASLKNDVAKLTTELNNVIVQRDQAKQALDENMAGSEAREKLYNVEKEKYEERFKNMDRQNELLLDQLQSLNTQLAAIQAQQMVEVSNTSMGDISLNRSITEEERPEQLMNIIKYLRQEKDFSIKKCEILESELARLKPQQERISKELEVAKAELEGERQKSEVSIITAAKHAEVLRKVETLNAITDSNRVLRIERDTLVVQVNELRAKTSSLEEQLAPLQEKNKELLLKSEAMQSENITLRTELTRWRQRANMLIEKSNRTSPEDWKKLQTERENLAKQLTIERSNTTDLKDKLNTANQEKARLEDLLKQVRQQQYAQKQELDHLTEELGSLRGQLVNLNEDLTQAREDIDKISKENAGLKDELEEKEKTLNDVKNNLVQIRKIAKKYKMQCEDLIKEMDGLKQQLEARGESEMLNEEKQEQLRQEGRSQIEERINELETQHNERLVDLNQQVAALTEASENYKKEIEDLKVATTEKEEKFKILFKNAKDRIVFLQEQLKEKSSQGKAGPSGEGQELDAGENSNLQAALERMEKEKEDIISEKQQEKEKLTAEIDSLTQRVNQLQRQLGLQQSSKPSTSSGPTEKTSTEPPPTANIKPMAGHSTNTQTQAVTIQPWRSGGEPPLASIRPMSMQLRTVAVPPTSQSPSAAMVPPQQQVHTTGSSNVEAMSSSPTSSHTDYAPATSSASSAQSGPRQATVPPTQSNQDTEDEDTSMQAQSAPQQQAVALVLPRVEPPSSGSSEQGTSSAGSSNTVTTTQAGLKRPREADTDSCQSEDASKTQQATKRTRVLGTEAFQGVSESGLVVEYQVPTSSQRDHEEEPDAVIVVESDEDGDVPDEGEGADDEPDDPDTETYDMEGISYPEQEINYEDDCQEVNLGNEVEVIEDSSEVPNQSERSAQEAVSQEESTEQPQSEAISSGTDGNSGVTVSQASTSLASTMPSLSRTRQVAPLSRSQQSHLLLPHGLDEGGDDGIVPSTPTLFVPRRSDGFGEAVSSPHVPTSGRFTFNEPGAQANVGSNEVVPEQTLEMSSMEDNSTGRSVPSTPLQASPQEYRSGSDEAQNIHTEGDIPTITVSGAVDDEQAPEGSSGDMGPPSVAGTSTEQSQVSEQHDDLMESEDGVTSEGEKPPTTEEGEEEGREAEASPSPNTRSRTTRGGSSSSRRSMRQMHGNRGMQRSGPTPIVWSGGDQNRTSPRQDMRGGRQPGFSPRVARRSRGRSQRPYSRF